MTKLTLTNGKEEIELTNKQKKLIIKALDFFGNKVADSEGYSSGEECWDLAELIKTGVEIEEEDDEYDDEYDANEIVNVFDLYEFAKKNEKINKEIIAVLPDGKKVPMTQQFYIESSIYYMLVEPEGNINKLTPSSLKVNLDYENEDSCWKSGNLDEVSPFGDCEVVFMNDEITNEEAEVYTISDIKETDEAFEFIMEI